MSNSRLISPQHLYDNPREWLNVPHELHEVSLKLMGKMFDDFQQKLISAKVHCLLCEGKEPFPVIIRTTGKLKTCTGYIGEQGNVELLRTT